MKIAMIGQKGIPASFGGIERHVEEIAIRMAQAGHTVIVYSRFWYTQYAQPTYHGVHIKLLPTIRTKHLDAITHTLLATIAAIHEQVDVIHYHGVGPALLSWIPRVFSPKTHVITTFHCIDRKHQKWGRAARFFLLLGEWCAVRCAHRTMVVSKTLQSYCVDNYQKATVYIPNGASCISEKDPQILLRMGLKHKQYILSVSRLVRHKGIHYLIQAFRDLNTPFRLVIVGDPYYSDEYAEELRQMAKGDDRILFAGNQTQPCLAALYEHAFLMVHPSESEGMPLSILEALGYGTAVVGSDIPEIGELISDPAYLFQNKNPQDLLEKLQHLLAHPDQVSETGKRAQQRIQREYHWDTIVAKILQVYTGEIPPLGRGVRKFRSPS